MFQDKKITVVGLGLLGRGLGDIAYLAEQGAELTVTDMKTAAQLKTSLDVLSKYPNIRYTLGEHKMEDFRNRDMILKAPKMPIDSPYIAEAKKNGVPVTMSTALFVKLAGIPTIGITGTRGKTTTTHMIYEILKANGKHVLLGGNIRGVSTLAMLPQIAPDTVAVLELDSWQLQGFREEGISPDIAVFTTLFPDHMDYYSGDMNAYLADKAEIFLNQFVGDTLVVGDQVLQIIRGKYDRVIKSNMIKASVHAFPAHWVLQIPGAHNRYNACCSLFAARAFGVDDAISQQALESFTGVEGRLQLVREINGVKIYNDTTATTPEATIAALEALQSTAGGMILIMGGYDKGLDMSALVRKARGVCKKILLLAGTGTDALRANGMLTDSNVYQSLSDAVTAAYAEAHPGDSLLFSPAFASFGMFKNEYDRGDQFDALVRAL